MWRPSTRPTTRMNSPKRLTATCRGGWEQPCEDEEWPFVERQVQLPTRDAGARRLPPQTHRSNGLMARLYGFRGGRVMQAVSHKCTRLTAHPEDLESKSAVPPRKHRDAKLLKALAHALLRRKSRTPHTVLRQPRVAMSRRISAIRRRAALGPC
jgi:hypothetical protein